MQRGMPWLLALGLVLPPAAQAQPRPQDGSTTPNVERYLELLRMDLRTAKVGILTEAMEFTTEEAARFWPIYRKYEMELTKLNDEEMALVHDSAPRLATMDEDTAKRLLDRILELQDRQFDLFRKTAGKVREELGAVRAVRFLQVEGLILRLIDLQLASEIPWLPSGTGSSSGRGTPGN